MNQVISANWSKIQNHVRDNTTQTWKKISFIDIYSREYVINITDLALIWLKNNCFGLGGQFLNHSHANSHDH